MHDDDLLVNQYETDSLWSLDIEEIKGHNLQAKGREEVNELIAQGWVLLNIYVIKYRDEDIWKERPMAILGRPRARRFAPTRYSS
jgi:hypothetical protein